MFWSANYITVRELNALLKEENVTLTQVLEADDILQECQTENQLLIQFLTRPAILSELVSLITEEPPKSVELASQYRHASIACEVLTSHLATLPDRLSADTVLMHRLCDFINCEPPLNPLLASYFSKTIEMLLEHSPKQDWYTYQIVCLRVLDFLKARRDFLPNLLRHIATSAVADVFKYFIRLDDLFSKTVLEWLEEHEFLECLIQIICGTYEPEPLVTGDTARPAHNHNDDNEHTTDEKRVSAGRGSRRAAAADNALALLCDLVMSGDACTTRARTWVSLGGRLCGGGGVRGVLAAAATAGGNGGHALGRAAKLLLALLRGPDTREGEGEYGCVRTGVEQAVAPHLPLLHQALLRPPTDEDDDSPRPPEDTSLTNARVGEPRVALAALLAALAASEVADVPNTLLALGTPALLLRLMFAHAHNNFLHAHVTAFVRRALDNWLYGDLYADHLFIECDLLTKLMDVYEENEEKKIKGGVRSGYMGHVVQLLRRVALAYSPSPPPPPQDPPAPPAPPRRPLPDSVATRWPAFVAAHRHTLQLYDLPLGGYYPSENAYEYNNTVVVGDDVGADNTTELTTGVGEGECGEGEGVDVADDAMNARNTFLELASQRFACDENMWDDEADEVGEAGEAHSDILADVSPWETSNEESSSAGEGWASFGDNFPSDPFGDGDTRHGGAGGDPTRGGGDPTGAEVDHAKARTDVTGAKEADEWMFAPGPTEAMLVELVKNFFNNADRQATAHTDIEHRSDEATPTPSPSTLKRTEVPERNETRHADEKETEIQKTVEVKEELAKSYSTETNETEPKEATKTPIPAPVPEPVSEPVQEPIAISIPEALSESVSEAVQEVVTEPVSEASSAAADSSASDDS